MKDAQVRELFRRFKAINPKPVTELEFTTPFELLVAVILSAQATDKGVNLATRKLYPVANTPQKMLALGQEGLASYVCTIGLYPTKVKNILAMCRILLDRYGGEVPRDRETLEALPGVGRKTANVVLNSAFGQPTMPVDTHIFRVANRLGLAHGSNPRDVEEQLLRRVPDDYLLDAHHWLLLHGRYICKARVPDCPRCPVVDLCEYDHKTLPLPDTLPLTRPVEERARRQTVAKARDATRRPAKRKTAAKSPRGRR